jgi:hypothetical protein
MNVNGLYIISQAHTHEGGDTSVLLYIFTHHTSHSPRVKNNNITRARRTMARGERGLLPDEHRHHIHIHSSRATDRAAQRPHNVPTNHNHNAYTIYII